MIAPTVNDGRLTRFLVPPQHVRFLLGRSGRGARTLHGQHHAEFGLPTLHPLIRFERFPTWADWLQKAGAPKVAAARGMKINNSAAVLQTAIEGHGIALARSVMAHDDLVAGRLVRLFPDSAFASPLAYYVIYRAECSSLPRLTAFRDWLMDEAAQQRC